MATVNCSACSMPDCKVRDLCIAASECPLQKTNYVPKSSKEIKEAWHNPITSLPDCDSPVVVAHYYDGWNIFTCTFKDGQFQNDDGEDISFYVEKWAFPKDIIEHDEFAKKIYDKYEKK